MQSLDEIQFAEGLHIDQYASQLVKLLRHRSNGADALTRAPLVEHVKLEADGLASNADPHTTLVWQLTGTVKRAKA